MLPRLRKLSNDFHHVHGGSQANGNGHGEISNDYCSYASPHGRTIYTRNIHPFATILRGSTKKSHARFDVGFLTTFSDYRLGLQVSETLLTVSTLTWLA